MIWGCLFTSGWHLEPSCQYSAWSLGQMRCTAKLEQMILWEGILGTVNLVAPVAEGQCPRMSQVYNFDALSCEVLIWDLGFWPPGLPVCSYCDKFDRWVQPLNTAAPQASNVQNGAPTWPNPKPIVCNWHVLSSVHPWGPCACAWGRIHWNAVPCETGDQGTLWSLSVYYFQLVLLFSVNFMLYLILAILVILVALSWGFWSPLASRLVVMDPSLGDTRFFWPRMVINWWPILEPWNFPGESMVNLWSIMVNNWNNNISGWWFGTCFMTSPIVGICWDDDPI